MVSGYTEDDGFQSFFISCSGIIESEKNHLKQIRSSDICKSLEGKQTVVDEVGGPIEAVACIEKCMENYKKKFAEDQ